MGSREMGRHWSTEERREISTMWTSEGLEAKYPKCVPLAKATRMTKSQKASAVDERELQVILEENQLT